MDSHRKRIKYNLKTSIEKFKSKTIDYDELIESISANINSLDNLDEELESARHRVCGKLEIIHYTIDTDKEFEAMLSEVKKFESFVDNKL